MGGGRVWMPGKGWAARQGRAPVLTLVKFKADEGEDERCVGGRQGEKEGRPVAQRPHVSISHSEHAQLGGWAALGDVQEGGWQETRGAVVDIRDCDGEGGGGGERRAAPVHGDHQHHALLAARGFAVQLSHQTDSPVPVHSKGVPAVLQPVIHALSAAL